MTDNRTTPPTIERLWEYTGLLILAACLAGPWVVLGFFGPLWSMVGAVVAVVVYHALLAPAGGICRGLFWLPVILNSALAVLVSLTTLLLRLP